MNRRSFLSAIFPALAILPVLPAVALASSKKSAVSFNSGSAAKYITGSKIKQSSDDLARQWVSSGTIMMRVMTPEVCAKAGVSFEEYYKEPGSSISIYEDESGNMKVGKALGDQEMVEDAWVGSLLERPPAPLKVIWTTPLDLSAYNKRTIGRERIILAGS